MEGGRGGEVVLYFEYIVLYAFDFEIILRGAGRVVK